MEAATDPLADVLHRVFGFKAFRKGQRETICALLESGRVLCIQPTGHGKSLLYQLPAYLLEGITIVISPLLALMRDQIDHLHKRFNIPAATINSDQSDEENAQARLFALEGKIRILFVSPEQLDHIDRFDFLSRLPITLLVIDEAHCISTWGHDFRPSYRQILHFIQALEKSHKNIKVLALTATADERVEKDIIKQLSYAQQKICVLREQMDRPNIHLSVIPASSIASKLLLCETLLSELEGSGLIYCATRENTELVAEFLKSQGISAKAYHAGLDSEEKRSIQEAFLHNSYKIVCATTALGMGIDKSNLRFVIHFDFPGSITAYYQEVGRSGRDGLKAQGILLYDPHDKKIQEHFIDSALPSSKNFEDVVTIVKTSAEPVTLSLIKRASGLHPTRVQIVVAELMEQGIFSKHSIKGSQVYRMQTEDFSLDLSRYTHQHLVKTQELEKMIEYSQQLDLCRMAILREALGDHSPSSCGRCDICTKTPFTFSPSLKRIEQIRVWLQERPVPIAASRIYRISDGIGILDGKLHSQLFIHFMKNRALSESIDEELLALIKKQASVLAERYAIGAIVPLPSRTWKSRGFVASALAEHLHVKAYDALLEWDAVPQKRQGELLNNDQRHHNVHEHMKVQLPISTPPQGALLLLDDYIGSGSSMKEAARALRKEFNNSVLIPFTLAAIKWHLGKPGFI